MDPDKNEKIADDYGDAILPDDQVNEVGDGNETDSEAESETGDESNSELDAAIEPLIDVGVWESIDKPLEEFEAEDMKSLSFTDHWSCIKFYKMYARVKGFGIRRKNPVKSKVDGHITSQLIWCNKEGHRDARHLERTDRRRREKPITRCGCKAFINFKWEYKTNLWHVTRFNGEHEHPLLPMSHVPFVRSHREVTEADKLRIKSLIVSGVRPSVTMRNFADTAGGRKNVGFLKSDLYNTWERLKKEEIIDGDSETVLAYLLGKKSSDPTFYVKFTRGEGNVIDKLLWCDGVSRKDYRAFGTAITFDATYKVNQYDKPFVVVVGVNHHRKTVIFGVALITNETEETYKWVLEQVLEAGDNEPPYTVVTDGDRAMANAIAAVFPNARHRLCLWHLMRNIKDKSNKNKKKMCSGFMKCVDACSTPTDFEKAWDEFTKKHEIEDEQWAKSLYEKKEKWSEAFLHGHFFAGMRTTQRCESMNSTLKTVLSRKLMLYRFVQAYDKLVENIRFDEDQDDFITTHTFPVIRGLLAEVKTHAARTYTSSMYYLVCKEMEYEARHIVYKCKKDQDHVDGQTNTYFLNDCVHKKFKYVVFYNVQQQMMCCCCARLEAIGFPCRHMFAVMKYENMVKIPDGCILRRWTMKAKAHLEDPFDLSDMDKKNDEKAADGRFAYLNGLSNQLCRMASTDYDRSVWLKDKLAKMILDLGKEKSTQVLPEASDNNDDNSNTKKIKTKKTSKGKGKSNIKGKAEIKKRKLEDMSVSIDDMENHNSKRPRVQTEFGPGFSFVNLLKQFMPNTFYPGEAAEAKDCCEYNVFEKDPTVFDWNPTKQF